MSLALFGQTIINGILIGLLFGLAGIGLTPIFGIMRILNLAQGTLMVLGAYIAYFSFVKYSIDPLISVFLSAGVGLVFGLVLYRSAIRRLVHRGHALASLLFLFGLSMVMETSMMELWSPFPRSIPVDYPGINLGLLIMAGNRTVVSFMAVIVALSFFAFLKWTFFGRNAYSIGGNESVSRLSGIKVNLYKISFFILCGFCASTAGVVLSSKLNTGTPIMGDNTPLFVITAVLLGGTSLQGGIGTIKGTLLGIMVLGSIDNGINLLNVSPYYQLLIKRLR